MKAILAIEDGTVHEGDSIGIPGTSFGELVFNTSMTGYQEIYTDPSYAGQIVMLTYPLIGNYAANDLDVESRRPHIRGVVMRELAAWPKSWRGQYTLTHFLRRFEIVGVAGVDTRAITRHIRSFGCMRSGVSTELTREELLEKVRQSPMVSGQDLVGSVTTGAPYDFTWTRDKEVLPGNIPYLPPAQRPYFVPIIDCGVKYNIARSLARRGCRVQVLPAGVSAEEVLAMKPDGVLLSNGPGDPKDAPHVVKTARELLGKTPVFGICLGLQMLALALGADTYKMKFGHRGANQPVKDMVRGRVVVTSQNHGFAVDEEGLDKLGIEVTHRNVNDGTVEGIAHRDYPMLSVQFHPEASPGPMDSGYLFDEFLKLIDNERNGKGARENAKK